MPLAKDLKRLFVGNFGYFGSIEALKIGMKIGENRIKVVEI